MLILSCNKLLLKHRNPTNFTWEMKKCADLVLKKNQQIVDMLESV